MTNYINGKKKREIIKDDREPTRFDFMITEEGGNPVIIKAPNDPWQWENVEYLFSNHGLDYFWCSDKNYDGVIFIGKKGYEFEDGR